MTVLVRLAMDSIRARHHPRAVLALWAWEAALGLFLGSQVASVASAAYGRHPLGDSPLFSAGSLELMDLLRHSASARAPLISSLALSLALSHFGGLIPSAAVLAELGLATPDRRAPSARDALSRAFAAFPASVTTSLLASAVEALVLLSGGALASAALGSSQLGEPAIDLRVAGVLAIFVLAAGAVGVVADVARAAVVLYGGGALDSIEKAGAACRRRPFTLLWSYAWRLAASGLPVAMGLFVTTRATREGTAAIGVILVLHQAIVLVRVALRASWMARSLRALRY